MIKQLNSSRSPASPTAVIGAIVSAVALSLIGIAAIETAEPFYAPVQMRWLVIALTIGTAVILPYPKLISAASIPLMVIATTLLIVILLPFIPRSIVPVRNGATCWINLYFMMFQPSELAKIASILALARYLRYRSNQRTLPGLIIPFAIMLVPMGLILVEPDLGSALLFIPALFAMLLAAGARLRHLASMVAIAAGFVVINVAIIYTLPDSMQVLKPHQRHRIIAMVSQLQGDRRYLKDIGYQQDKAMTLVGSGGMTGFGAKGSRSIVRYNKLPEDHNDMIFAVVVNRWGLAGAFGVLTLYLTLMGSFLTIAAKCKDPFCRMASVGFAGLIVGQAAINIGMTVGLLPVTGITLPFVSYGGSSLVATYMMLGLVVNFGIRRPAFVSRPSFEFDQPNAATT